MRTHPLDFDAATEQRILALDAAGHKLSSIKHAIGCQGVNSRALKGKIARLKSQQQLMRPERIWRMLVFYEAKRAGISPASVFAHDSQRAASKSLVWNRINGCKLICIYIAHSSFSLSYQVVAALANVSKTTVASTVNNIAELRDLEPELDRWLSELEDGLGT